MAEALGTSRIFANKNQPNWKAFRTMGQRPAPALRGVSKMYYPPDGSGRDVYAIIENGGTQRNFKRAYVDCEGGEYLRDDKMHKFETPVMDYRHQSPSMR